MTEQNTPANPSAKKIGWVGTGVMGRWMCHHLMEKGYPAAVHTRTRSKAQPLLDQGASWAESPGMVARQADVVLTMVGFPNDVREVYFGSGGILEETRPNMILVDMTTTSPSLAEEIARAAAGKGAFAVDAPVSGGDVGARNAALSIMAGGERSAFEEILPILKVMGSKIVYQGGAGAGQHAKMCNQIVIAGTMVGMCESLLYAQKAGLDAEVMLSSIIGGAAACWSLDQLAPRILRGEYETGFFVEHFVKDMGIALDEARRMKLSMPGLALVHQLYQAVLANGGGRLGTQSLILALRQMSNLGGAGRLKR